MRLLIAIPIKNETEGRDYKERSIACQDTWLKNCPCDYKFFTDDELGLDYNRPDIRTMRTKLMAKYAFENGYDYIFRTDSDAYVWVNRLLACGFEQYDYMGHCLDYKDKFNPRRTAHGGIGFFLSRRAMQFVIDTPPFRCLDGNYWGDIWTGEVMTRNRISCKRDLRFMDGSGSSKHHGNIFAHELPDNHPYVSVHPVPIENMYEMHKRFPDMSSETVEPAEQIFDPDKYPENR